MELGVWLEWLATAAVVVMATVSLCAAFWPQFPSGIDLRTFSVLQQGAEALRQEPDSVRREAFFSGESDSMAEISRLLDIMMPPNTRVFVLDTLGPENFGNLGFYYYLNYYLYPREVAISLGQPPVFQIDGVTGRSAVSPAELAQAGYDYAVRIKSGQLKIIAVGAPQSQLPEARPKLIPKGDWLLALLLPLAVAITGSRMIRWLFRDLNGILTTGELLASGLAVGACIS